jgi:transposase
MSKDASVGRRPYPWDLTDEQWTVLEPLIPPEKPGGRHREVDMREIINGIVYLNRTGCQWRALPHDLPPWPTVHDYYRRFRREGVWPAINHASVAIIDSQSVKTTEKGGSAGMTRARRSTAASGTSSSTSSACC